MTDLPAKAKEALALAVAATPGPWTTADSDNKHMVTFKSKDKHRAFRYVAEAWQIDEDAAFIAASRELLPLLAQAVIDQAAQLTAAEKMVEAAHTGSTWALRNAVVHYDNAYPKRTEKP